MMNVLDLFSGIGGFSLGLESTGFFKTIAFVEKDRFCQKVLQKNFPNVPIEDEIRNVKGSRYQADVVTGGFPCQPFSIAGKRKGTDDDRYLWDETLRVVAETKPKWFVGENVEGIVNINNGTVLQQIQKDLESEGFQVQCLVIPASGVGAWHQRKRVWIVAYSDKFRCTQHNETKKEKFEWRSKTSFMSSSSQDVSNSNERNVEARRERQRKIRKEHTEERLSSDASGIREALSNSNEQRLERHRKKYQLREIKQEKNIEWSGNDGTKKSWWQIESKLRGIPDGICTGLDKDRTNRIKALGNSIVPQIAFEIGRAIIRAEEQQT
jgi:DNA (cytosine-5)-methyltransferase 1